MCWVQVFHHTVIIWETFCCLTNAYTYSTNLHNFSKKTILQGSCCSSQSNSSHRARPLNRGLLLYRAPLGLWTINCILQLLLKVLLISIIFSSCCTWLYIRASMDLSLLIDSLVHKQFLRSRILLIAWLSVTPMQQRRKWFCIVSKSWLQSLFAPSIKKSP